LVFLFGIKMEYVYEIRLHYGKKLPKMDVIGTIDPYVRICFPSGKVTSRVITQDPNPQWETDVDVLVGQAPASWPICVELWDKDKGSKDDFVCKIDVPSEDLPCIRREFKVERKNADPDAVICMTVARFPAVEEAKKAVEGKKDEMTFVDSKTEGYGFHTPVKESPQFSMGLQYDIRNHVHLYLAQSDPASVVDMAAFFVSREVPIPNRVASHLITSETDIDPSRLDVLRRVGGARGLRVFGECSVFPAGCFRDYDKLSIRVVRKKTLVSCQKAIEIARAHNYPRISGSFEESVKNLKNSLVDNENKLVYFMGDPDMALSLMFSLTAPQVVGYSLKPNIMVDVIYTVENERVMEFFPSETPIPNINTKAYTRCRVAQAPKQCRLEQIYILKYTIEDTIDVSAKSVLPLPL